MNRLMELDPVQDVSEQVVNNTSRLHARSFDVPEDPSVRRQSAFAMLAKYAQQTTGNRQLFVEAAILAARTLEFDLFVAAHLQTDLSTLVALSGQRPCLHTDVEMTETTFQLGDPRYLVGQVANGTEPLVISDLVAEGQTNDPLLRQLGAGSAMICPIQYAGHPYGAIGVLMKTPKRASVEDMLFLQSLSLLLGPTVAYQRTENALTQHSAMLNATIDALDSMVLVLSPDGTILRLNQACQERTGFKAEELKHRHFWGAYLLPEEVAVAQEAFGKLRRGQSPVKCEMFLLTKAGERRRIAWSFTHLADLGGGPMSYVASGIDITEQHAALASLERAEASVARLLAGKDDDGRQHAGRASEDAPPIPKNRRNSLRQAFPYIQLIGPMKNGCLPHAEEFQEVRCRDISPSGFSYVTKTPPDFQELVVALGAYPTQLYLTAKIVHVNRYRENGQDLMLVGCSYTSRVGL